MPSPIGHSIAGLIISVLRNRIGSWKQWLNHWKQGILYVLLANLPDIDFFDPRTGRWTMQADGFHHQQVHSIGFAVLVALSIGMIGWIAKRKWIWSAVFWSFIAVGSHILLDYLFSNPPPGMPIFFPFTSVKFPSPLGLAYQLDETDLFGRGNWIRVSTEGAIALAVLMTLVSYFVQQAQNRSRR